MVVSSPTYLLQVYDYTWTYRGTTCSFKSLFVFSGMRAGSTGASGGGGGAIVLAGVATLLEGCRGRGFGSGGGECAIVSEIRRPRIVDRQKYRTSDS